jgi:drug/metabolite transporter (DMT)-like permease
MEKSQKKNRGLNAAIASAIFFGMAPVFGKMAIVSGMPWTAVVGLRTILAALLLLIVMFFFKRSSFYIYPIGLLGCILAGVVNGTGSLLYYGSLSRIDASLGQIIYSLYPLFVTLWLLLDRQPPSRLTIFRLLLVFPALFLLSSSGQNEIDIFGVLMMLGAAVLYALHLPINQRVLYDIPAPTVTLYTLLSMSVVVMPVFFFSNLSVAFPETQAWAALFILTLITFLSRVTLFTGVKYIGGSQTALLGLGELIIAIILAHILLQDRLELTQWAGVVLLVLILLLVKFEKTSIKKPAAQGWLGWLRAPSLPVELNRE